MNEALAVALVVGTALMSAVVTINGGGDKTRRDSERGGRARSTKTTGTRGHHDQHEGGAV